MSDAFSVSWTFFREQKDSLERLTALPSLSVPRWMIVDSTEPRRIGPSGRQRCQEQDPGMRVRSRAAPIYRAKSWGAYGPVSDADVA